MGTRLPSASSTWKVKVAPAGKAAPEGAAPTVTVTGLGLAPGSRVVATSTWVPPSGTVNSTGAAGRAKVPPSGSSGDSVKYSR